MHYLSPCAFAIAVFFATAHNSMPVGAVKQNAPELSPESHNRVELNLKDGFLTATQDGSDPVSWELPDAKPYHVVTLGPPAIVTTCGESLEVHSIIATPSLPSFANMLPILVEPPFVVLAEMAVHDTTQNGKISLIGADGKVAWHSQDGMLVLPSAGELPDQLYMFATTPGSTPLLPMGENPELVMLNAQTATEVWRVALPLDSTPVDVQLLAVDGGRGLLLLQTGYVTFEFVVLDLISGAYLQSWQLSGQVATQIVYPGGFSRLAPFGLDNNVVSLVVNNLEETTQMWSFNLARLSLEKSPAEPPRYNIDENGLPLGGTGIPDPQNPPFPQGILPTQFGTEWTVPALVDGNGRVLVVNGGEAIWMEYNRIVGID